MFKATNGRQYNLAAKTIRAFLAEKDVQLKHSQALELAGRLTGFASYAAAESALQRKSGNSACDVRTWGDLAQALSALDDEQLNMPIQVTDGGCGSSVASFAGALQLVRADDADSVANVATAFLRNQPILLIGLMEVNMPQGGIPNEDVLRVRMQFEAATGESGLVAENCIAKVGLKDGIDWLNREYDIDTQVGPYVLYSEKEQGFFNTDQGWVFDKASARGFLSTDSWSLVGIDDGELVPYETAVDVDPDDANSNDPRVLFRFGVVRGAPVSRYQWQKRYRAIWEELHPRIQATLSQVGQAVAEMGYVAKLDMNRGDAHSTATLDFSKKDDGSFVGGISIILTDGAVDYGVRAAALELYYKSARGHTAVISEGSSAATHYATEAQYFLDPTDWLDPGAMLKIVQFQLNAEERSRNK